MRSKTIPWLIQFFRDGLPGLSDDDVAVYAAIILALSCDTTENMTLAEVENEADLLLVQYGFRPLGDRLNSAG